MTTPTAQQQQQQQQEFDEAQQRCERLIDKVYNRSMQNAFVTFMRSKMEEKGCPVDRSFFKCSSIQEKAVGGFSLTDGVVISPQHASTYKQMQKVVTHELIHAFDHCRAHVDWQNLEHHACSEVRAANLSTECHFTDELRRGHQPGAKHHQECVRRRAILSVRMNPECQSEEQAAEVVDKVFDVCFGDTEPFDRIP